MRTTKKQSASVLHERVHHSVPDEGSTILFQCEMHADCFFHFVWNFAPRIQYTGTNFEHFNTDILCSKDDTLHKEPDKWCTGDCCPNATIPMFTLLCLCRNFRPIMTRLFPCTPFIPQIRHPLTSLS